MSIETNAGFEQAAAAPSYGALMLVEMQFRSGTARLTTWPTNVTAMGHTWTAMGTMGRVGDLHESEDGAEEKLDLVLSGVDDSLHAAVLGNPGEYQDQPVAVWLALLDAQTLQLSGAPALRFSGVMDQAALSGNKDEVTMHCRTATYDVRSNPTGLRYSHAQHQAEHPGEMLFQYSESLVSDTTVWVSAAFQRARG